MSDNTSSVQIPDGTRKQFPEFIALILESASMDDKERQYWINMLPVMKPDQLQSLKDILENEKRKLAALDAKYGKKLSEKAEKASVAEIEKERTEKRSAREEYEEEHEKEESQKEQQLLDQIASFGTTTPSDSDEDDNAQSAV